MSNPHNHSNEREETPMTDIEISFGNLIDALAQFGDKLTASQYEALEKYLPEDRDCGLTTDELGKRVGELVGKNSGPHDFSNVLTDAFIEAMQSSPDRMTKTQLESIAKLIPEGVTNDFLAGVGYNEAVAYIVEYIKCSNGYSQNPLACSEMVTELVSEVMVKLDAGFTMDSLARICQHFDGKDVIVPTILDDSNPREQGLILDHGGETVRFTIPTGRPKALNDLSDEIMDLADRLDTFSFTVDDRAWDMLLIYAPQHRALKKRLKKIEKAVGLTEMRKQIKRMVG